MQKYSISLLGTSYCHLCEEAVEILNKVNIDYLKYKKTLIWNKVDILDNSSLYDQYALKIPVLRIEQADQHQELFWPFDLLAVQDFLEISER